MHFYALSSMHGWRATQLGLQRGTDVVDSIVICATLSAGGDHRVGRQGQILPYFAKQINKVRLQLSISQVCGVVVGTKHGFIGKLHNPHNHLSIFRLSQLFRGGVLEQILSSPFLLRCHIIMHLHAMFIVIMPIGYNTKGGSNGHFNDADPWLASVSPSLPPSPTLIHSLQSTHGRGGLRLMGLWTIMLRLLCFFVRPITHDVHTPQWKYQHLSSKQTNALNYTSTCVLWCSFKPILVYENIGLSITHVLSLQNLMFVIAINWCPVHKI